MCGRSRGRRYGLDFGHQRADSRGLEYDLSSMARLCMERVNLKSIIAFPGRKSTVGISLGGCRDTGFTDGRVRRNFSGTHLPGDNKVVSITSNIDEDRAGMITFDNLSATKHEIPV